MKCLTAVGALMVVALPLAAQQPRPMQRDTTRPRMMMQDQEMMSHMSQMHDMMGPMMRAMAFSPAHLLERKDVLKLTPEQVTRLTALRDDMKKAHDAAGAEAKQHMQALEQSMQANAPDSAALRRHFQAAHTAMGNAHWSGLRAAAQARGVLNDAQRGRVEGWADAMQMHQRVRMGEQRHEGHERP
jgi:hypothetical protein